MASCITEEWVNTAPQLKLTVSEISSTSTTVTLHWLVQLVIHSKPSANPRPYKAYVNGELVSSGDISISRSPGTYDIDGAQFTVSRGTSSKTISFSCSIDWADLKWSGVVGGNKSANGSITIAGVQSYTIKYNANGGTGAPSSQTKTHGTNITLSSTVPTRTGYTFQGWATSSSSTTVEYAKGATYKDNASVTLYAVWKANTYTISYNANGGTGAPSSQTKTHGKDLTISTTEPTRTNYIFQGWGVSASSTTVSYNPGDVYDKNTSTTLYAIWVLGYMKPRVTNMDVDRCDSSGNVSDDGTSILVVFDWATDVSVKSITIAWKLSSATTYGNSVSVTATGTSGSVSKVINTFTFDIDATYDIQVTVADSKGSNPFARSVGGSQFAIDVMPEDKGIAFGKAAELEGVCDIAYQIRHLGGVLQPLLAPGVDFNEVKTPNTYTLKNAGSNPYINWPFESGTGTLVVESAGDVGQTHQIATYCNKTMMKRYERFFYLEEWGDWFVTYYDSGWQNPTLTSDFVLYNTTANSTVQYRRVGQMVEIRGAVKPTRNDIGGNTEQYTIFELPEDFRPSTRIALRMQSSNTTTWLLTITADGLVQFSRYGDGIDMFNADTGTWLPFQAMFFAD